MNFTSRAVVAVWLVGLMLPFSGCAEQQSGLDVEGTITYDNAPVEKGIIKFLPTQGQQARFTEFAGGRYELKGNSAPDPGTYLVEIDGFKKVKDPRAPAHVTDENGMIEKPYLPEKYNARSELTVEIKEGQSQYDFNLKK